MMRCLLDVAVLLPLVVAVLACASAPSPAEHPAAAPELVGPLSRAEIEAGIPDWVVAQIESSPDAEQALAMAAAGGGDARVTVYLGTWCSDSRRELSRFWRAIDEAGGEVAFELAYVGIHRDRTRRDPALAEVGLQYVPTFVVELSGAETGRIVETSPNGIERDLAELLNGEVTGVVSAREDLRP